MIEEKRAKSSTYLIFEFERIEGVELKLRVPFL